MKPVRFHPDAESELAHAVDYYNKRVPGLGTDFVAVVKRAADLIQSSPLRRPRCQDGTRKMNLRRFPFAIVYREKPDVLEIIAIAHGARRPNYWRKRI